MAESPPSAPPPPSRPKRRKTGGRKKGTPNKATLTFTQLIVYAMGKLQEGHGELAGHLIAFGRDHPIEFYRMAAKVAPGHSVLPAAPPVTRVEFVTPGLDPDSPPPGFPDDPE